MTAATTESNPSSSLKSSASTTKSTPAVPVQWPPQVGELYEPVRELGRGGFASVMLAKNKDSKQLVAIKVVGSKDPTRQQVGYAHREIDILQELRHSNIMQLYAWYKPDAQAEHRQCAAVMALSYAKGPTLEALLKLGGKLSLTFARVVSAQLVDAVAYLHSCAVLHRDVKPDNLIVTGAFRSQDDIWDDTQEDPDWKALLNKWHVTLVDFGFARALTPQDVQKGTRDGGSQDFTSQELTPDDSSLSLSSSGRKKKSIAKSVSRRFTRNMSAVGNRLYAAPEITKGVRKNLDKSGSKKNRTTKNGINDSYHSSVDVTRTLADHVSDYGMMVDAFSIGNTIKYMLTGVPPDQDVNAAIAAQQNPLAKLGRFLKKKKKDSDKKKKPTVRKVQYRPVSDIPPEAVRLVQGCTKPNAQQRTSVRAARLYPWIDDVFDGDELPSYMASNEISYLNLALDKPKTSAKPTAIEEEETETMNDDELQSEPVAAN